MGEQRWLEEGPAGKTGGRGQRIAVQHAISMAGLPLLIEGLRRYRLGRLLLGMGRVYLGKIWFLQEMVRLQEGRRGKGKRAKLIAIRTFAGKAG